MFAEVDTDEGVTGVAGPITTDQVSTIGQYLPRGAAEIHCHEVVFSGSSGLRVGPPKM